MKQFLFVVPLTPTKLLTPLRRMLFQEFIRALNNQKYSNWQALLIGEEEKQEGNITYANVREEFCKKYKTSSPTINNIISKLKKMNIFIKQDGKVKINPIIVLDFNKELSLQISLTNE